ncbi:hypothetical protein ACFVUP_38060 [Streptomyces bacillaris]|uniref:hypothetical protein n=1 Tax=Streptomyces bacillaris TaxID=68179 RepID=UPI0036D81863
MTHTHPTPTVDVEEPPTVPVCSPRIPLTPRDETERARKQQLEQEWEDQVAELRDAGQVPVHRTVMENFRSNDYLVMLLVQVVS